MLDARPVPGGGVASEELLLPGFQLDSCSTGHTLIQTNPVLADDELGLIAEHGLAYIAARPGRARRVPRRRVADDVARPRAHLRGDRALLPRRRASAYRRLLAEYDAVKDVFNRQRFTPVGFGPSFEELLDGPRGRGRAGDAGRR